MKLNPIISAVLDHAVQVQAERLRCEATVKAHCTNTLPGLQQAREQTARALAEAEARLYSALTVADAVVADRAEAECVALAAKSDGADRALERGERVAGVLRKQLRQAEEAQTAEIVVLRSIVQQHAQDVTMLLAQEIREAAEPLIAVTRKAAFIAGAVGMSNVMRALDKLLIPDPSNPGVPILDGRFPGKLDDDEAVALARDVGEPARVLRDLESFVPLAVREAAAASRKGSHAGRNTLDVTPPVAAEDEQITPPMVRPLPPPARRGRGAAGAARLT